MALIPILSGINTSVSADFSTSYPRNLIPVPKNTGLSLGYLKLAEGISQFGLFDASIIGIDRGGINWNGGCYRVIGQYFIRVNSDGSVDNLATVPLGGYVKFDFSFDRLALACSGNLYYWNGTTLTQVTDVDLRTVVDMIWIDGYFMTTDGQYVVVTDLANPMSVNPLKYGSIDSDPSPIVGLLKVRDEAYALSRYVISPLDNVGGSNFPFSVVKGAIIQKGSIGTRTACVYHETIAFMGSARNEQPSIYLVSAGSSVKIATRQIEQELKKYTEAQLSVALLESRSHDIHEHLYIHLPDQTLVYDHPASVEAGVPVWFHLGSSTDGYGLYRARNFVWCYDKWLCGDLIDARKIGVLTTNTAAQYDSEIGYQFDTAIMYGEGFGAIISSMELITLAGAPIGDATDNTEQYIRRSYSVDGRQWSQPSQKSLGKAGQTKKRPLWLGCGLVRNWRIERFQGLTKVPVAFARLEVDFEKLNT
jgi:hypothetical protein